MRFGCALGEIYGPDRKFGLWGRSGGWHILQGRKDSQWAAVQNAAYGQLRYDLIMGVGHMQASVAAAARRMWVVTVDSIATSRGVRGEPGRPADINSAVGHRRKPQHCKDRSAARATEGGRESSFFWPRGAEYASAQLVLRGGDAGRSVVDAQRGRRSSCWLCQLTALDHGGGLSRTRRGVGEWAWAFESNEG